jgi:hypothetical protein
MYPIVPRGFLASWEDFGKNFFGQANHLLTDRSIESNGCSMSCVASL